MDEEIDDFANDEEIQRLRKTQDEYEELLETCVDILTKELSLVPADCMDIEPFLLYKTFDSPNIVETFRSTAGNFEIEVYLVEYRWTSRTKNTVTTGINHCFLGMLFLNKEYPPTCFFKESLRTKVTDWFTKEDVDFKNQEKFSSQFHLISSDKAKLRDLLLNRPLDELADFPGMEAEVRGKRCLFKVSGDPASEYDAKNLVDLARKLHRVFG